MDEQVMVHLEKRARKILAAATCGDEMAIAAFDRNMNRRKMFSNLAGGLGLSLLAPGAMNLLFGRGLLPAAWADTPAVAGKPGMMVHNTRPINGEFMPHELNDLVTPINRHFVRNNALVPKVDIKTWRLQIDGLVEKPLSISLQELKAMPAKSYNLLIECGGNGRALFDPPVRGNPWGRGAVSCSQWTGVPLQDLLSRAVLKKGAVYTGHWGDDLPLGQAEPFSRGIPIDKALEPHTLVAYKMNGKDLPANHGYPVRLVVPGWVGSASEKWLSRVKILDKVHDSQKMRGYSYRVPKYPAVPGVKPPEKDMEIATAWQIKSMITSHAPEHKLKEPGSLRLYGQAWAGESKVSHVDISKDFGATWQRALLKDPANKYAWQRFEAQLEFSRKGYYEVWARATDHRGVSQPFQQPWNPKGYMGNMMHRIPILVGVA